MRLKFNLPKIPDLKRTNDELLILIFCSKVDWLRQKNHSQRKRFSEMILVVAPGLMEFYYFSSTSISTAMEKANNFISDRVRRV